MTGPANLSRRMVLGLGLGAVSLGTGLARADQGLSLRPAPRPRPFDQRADADEVLRRSGLVGDVAWVVVDVDTGDIIDARLAHKLFPPASTLKAVTALYALDRLGGSFRFATRVLVDGDRLVLVGEGDPVLDSDALADLARMTAQAGLASPAAFLVWPRWPTEEVAVIDPMQADYLPYNPTISGLNLNFNRVHMAWRQGGGAPVISLEARGRRVSPVAYSIAVRAVGRGAPLFVYEGGDKREEWTVASSALRQPGSRWLPVRRPTLYAGDVFQTLARAEGLALPAPVPGQAGPDAYEIARHDSPPLREIVLGMLEHSTNLTAEVLGLRASGQAGLRASATAMADWARGHGVQGPIEFFDHSGLSAQSRVSAMMLAQLLSGAGQTANLGADLQPVERIGADGKKGDWPAGLNVTGKTGTLNFVSNLVGYIDKIDGRRLGFAILSRDAARHGASIGQEIPAGVIGWTRRARALQSQLIMGWGSGSG